MNANKYANSSRLARSLLLTVICVAAAAPLNGEILSSSRRINWDPGVRGGIPARTTIYQTLGTSATAAQIQSALNSCPSNQVVKLTAGTFTINSILKIPTGRTLRGDGIKATILQGASGFSGNSFITFDNSFDSSWSSPARSLVSPTKDDSTITTTAEHGWVAGDIVLIDMLKDPAGDPPIDNAGSLGSAGWVGRASGTRPIGQWVRIVSVPSSTTATIDPPLYWSYANSPQGVKMTGLTHYAGVEDLGIDNLTSTVRDTVGIFGAINCWLYNVELKGNNRYALWGYGALWFTLQKCHLNGGTPIGTDKTAAYDSSRSYPLFMGPHFTAGLITDNIIEKLTSGVDWEGCASGNVFSYNLITNMWWKNTGDSPRRFGPLMHGPHPFMNLIEGNWSSDRIRADEYWGTSSHFTVLRNRIVQTDRGADDGQMWTIDIERRNWYWSFIGNLLGGSGSVNEDNYEYINGENAPYGDSHSTIWKIGYNSLGTGSSLYDSGTLRTMVRWGNWSHRTNDSVPGSGVVFHTNGVVDLGDTVIPNSYYLSGKPSFFGALNWPPYDPYKPTANSLTNIPAGYRYVYGVSPVSGPVNQPPTAVANATPRLGSTPLSVVFSSAGSSDPEGAVLSYSWVLGDGGTSTSANPTKVYVTPGTYTARLTVSDGPNAVVSSNLVITVTAPGVNLPPVAAAGATPTSGMPPLSVNFSSAGSLDPEGGTLTYNWTFGDGTSSTVASPSHTYSTEGNYLAKVTVSDGTNAVSSSSIAITVSSGLVAAFGFEEAGGNTVIDAAPSANRGSLNSVTRTAGKYGMGLSFDSANSVVIVTNSPSLQLSAAMTIEAWVNPSVVSGDRNIVYKDNWNYCLAGSSTGSAMPNVSGTFAPAGLFGSQALPAGAWSHLATTYDGTTLRLYLNGALIGTQAQTGPIEASPGHLMIGGNASVAGKTWSGKIDEVRIYNRALSAAEIQADMATSVVSTSTPNTPPAPPEGLRVVPQ